MRESILLTRETVGHNPSWVASRNCISRDIFRHDRTCAYHGTFSDVNSAEDDRSSSDPDISPNVNGVPITGCAVRDPSRERDGHADFIECVIVPPHDLHPHADEGEVSDLAVDLKNRSRPHGHVLTYP